MVNYEKLTKAGMDVDAFLARLMGNASLLKVFVGKFISDTNFKSLCDAFVEGDMKKAEMASHTLKGMCGNMSLTELFALFGEQTNLIRAGESIKAERMMDIITQKYETAISFMKVWHSEA